MLIGLVIVAALSGCAQFQSQRPDASANAGAPAAASKKIVDFVVPADALGARDPQLTEVLAKVGSVASKQPQPTTVVVAALPQDFAYLNQSVKRGIAPQRMTAVRLENVAVGSCQPYSVQVKPTE
ncbi:hypothetical protein FAZ69_30965 [Trinickia terrae]|uniref:Uncharacterized protein n=1 Tax=Trinickia terrae TaxID=2571161 RepID=A0A4U1HDT6_9BURK|nr:hypothetical protein FAZ69_30965 [Trinickia terrae]